jgi:hypothetical protein
MSVELVTSAEQMEAFLATYVAGWAVIIRRSGTHDLCPLGLELIGFALTS